MDRVALTIGALGVAVLYETMRQTSRTAGDDESNFVMDGIDTLNAYTSGWPTGSGPYQELISASAEQYGVPASILAWLLWKESRFIADVIDGTRTSSAGALGIAQFMPATAREELGSVEAALEPALAIPGAARYLAKLRRSAGSWAGALAAYNWGIGNVQRKGIDAAPPETVDYFTTILSKAGGIYA